MNLGLAGIKILAGNSNPALAQKIANELNVPIAKCDVTHFSDGEINVNIMETVRGMDVFIIQPTCSPVNDNLMELLILIDAVKGLLLEESMQLSHIMGMLDKIERPRQESQ